MKEECILCKKIAEVGRPNAKKGEFYVECDICKNYSYDHFFKSAYISMTEDKRAMISAYTRECYELEIEPPKLGDPDHLREKREEYKNKTNDEKLDNLILYLKKNSKRFGDSIPWDEKKDYPITYSPNHQEAAEIVHQAFKQGLKEEGARGVALKLTWEGWKRGEYLEKRNKMKIAEKRQQFLQKLYELTESNENDIRDMWEIGKSLGFPNNLTNRIGQYLEGEGLIVFRTEQGEISIKHEGE